MKQRILLAGTILILAAAMPAAGADVAGKWVAERDGAQGINQTTFNFTVDGNTLTGTVSGGRNGDAEIIEGKIEGDDISFVVVRAVGDNEIRTLHRGKISGDEIRFTIERQGGGLGLGPGGGGRMGGPGGGPGAKGPGGPGGGQGRGLGGPPQELVAKRAQ